ncbi:T9SS type A sorting domain-containing protein [Flavisolibacter ginsengisoli]|jgi:uncharacterized delta-60 repeat protein|uniref:Delta-60 repeat domain-containing protein/Por secretion system C-terminal sorting domain-containing protein n=1 Tax=Flavisolibacter ginsengisoli DSM 18119 TaxID=1121884 RepID=A0A1M5BSZ5_9BACT|nr:T9SS type A sorting domain-containing protein [Flavisolibacter ginsengisoli]SHF45536.1 delta-60 repeat domain-containing protein/Por secretion system C-terminal sorting domain-containing protein [Flavisolibacter ginsengisoli DSM 18119]
MKKIVMVLILTALFKTIFSQAGNLDPSFGNHGIVRTDFGSREIMYDNQCQQILLSPDGSFYLVFAMNKQTLITHRLTNGALDSAYGEGGYSVPVFIREPKAVMQADGKIIIGGTTQTSDKKDFALARFNTDGTLDNSFSGDGSVTMDFSSTDDSFFGMALQPNGKIVMVGSTYDNVRDRIALARFNSDGTADNSFSGDGKLQTNLIGAAGANGVAIQPDGKIVIAGYFSQSGVIRMALARYLPDGNMDLSFGLNGFQFIVNGWNSVAKAIVIQPDGKIIAGGFTLNNVNVMQFMLVRLNTDGSLDPTFSGDGIQISQMTDNDDLVNAMALQTDGKIVVAGAARTYAYQDFIVARYTADGNLDNSFSSDGFDIPGVNEYQSTAGASASSLVILPSGKIMIAGTYRYSMGIAVAGYHADGTLNNSFGVAGILKDFKHSSRTVYEASAVQPDGKIITAGVTQMSPEALDFIVIRYNKNGSYDMSFSGDGVVMPKFGMGGAEAKAIAIQPDGKIVVAGYFWNGSTGKFDMAVIRLNPDGSPDNSFSGDGQLLMKIRDYTIATDLVIQPDGKIVVGGYTASTNGGIDMALVRYNSDGTLDNTFSGDGMLTVDFGSDDDRVVSLLLQPDGKLMVVGEAQTGKIVLARFNPDGSPDLSFDGDGMVITGDGTFSNAATDGLLQPDGKIVVVGIKDNHFWIERFNSNGSVDNSFSEDGNLEINFNLGNEQATSIVLQPDGKLIIGGYAKGWPLTDMALARVNTDGSLDNSFSTDGKAVIELGWGIDEIHSLSIQGNRLYAAGKTTYGGELGMLAAIQLGCDLTVNIPGAITMKRGVDSNTVYQGYAPAGAITLKAQSTGGAEPYTYLWSNGAVTTSVTVSPTMATTYSVTVTDASGCSQTMSKLINVVDVRCGNKMDKVLVCQVPPGRPSNAHTICVGANAVAAHLNNGSRLGNCSHDASITKRNASDEQMEENAVGIQVYPNPTHSSFTLLYTAVNRSLTDLVVYDVSGRVVEKRNITPGKPLELGAAYRPGIYYVQLTQGEVKTWTKIVKQAW